MHPFACTQLFSNSAHDIAFSAWFLAASSGKKTTIFPAATSNASSGVLCFHRTQQRRGQCFPTTRSNMLTLCAVAPIHDPSAPPQLLSPSSCYMPTSVTVAQMGQSRTFCRGTLQRLPKGCRAKLQSQLELPWGWWGLTPRRAVLHSLSSSSSVPAATGGNTEFRSQGRGWLCLFHLLAVLASSFLGRGLFEKQCGTSAYHQNCRGSLHSQPKHSDFRSLLPSQPLLFPWPYLTKEKDVSPNYPALRCCWLQPQNQPVAWGATLLQEQKHCASHAAFAGQPQRQKSVAEPPTRTIIPMRLLS